MKGLEHNNSVWDQVRRDLMLGCYMFVLWLRMALVDIAERLRHEMELITKTELVLGPTDVDQPRNTSKDPLHVPNGPMTRSKTKALKEALVFNVSTKSELKGPLEYQEETLVHLKLLAYGSQLKSYVSVLCS
jgi:hypothetical protein